MSLRVRDSQYSVCSAGMAASQPQPQFTSGGVFNTAPPAPGIAAGYGRFQAPHSMAGAQTGAYGYGATASSELLCHSDDPRACRYARAELRRNWQHVHRLRRGRVRRRNELSAKQIDGRNDRTVSVEDDGGRTET